MGAFLRKNAEIGQEKGEIDVQRYILVSLGKSMEGYGGQWKFMRNQRNEPQTNQQSLIE